MAVKVNKTQNNTYFRAKGINDRVNKFDIDLDENYQGNYAAYVYRITITLADGTTKKIYIGAHKGSIYDPYLFSIDSKGFLSDLRNSENKIYFEIVKKGTEYDMFDLENQMLEEVNAKMPNNNYYNSTNGGSRYTSVSARKEAYAISIIEKFNNGEYDEYIQDISTEDGKWHKLPKIQIRPDEVADPEYTQQIAVDVDSKYFGNTDFLPPCLALGGYGVTILWMNGTQRFTGVEKSELGKSVKTVVLPKKIWGLLTDNKNEITQILIDMAFELNPQTGAPLHMKPAAIAINVMNRSKAYDEIDSDRTYRHLSRQGKVGTLAKYIITESQKLWKNREKAQSYGENMHYHNSTSTQGKKIIAKRKQEIIDANPNATVIVSSSSTFGIGNMEGILLKSVNEGQTYPKKLVKFPKEKPHTIIPLIHHPDDDYQEVWENGKSAKDKMSCKSWISQYGYKLAPYRIIDMIAPEVTGIADE